MGFIPPLLAILAPRQVVSRHFHNAYEIEAFAGMEYQQRREVYANLSDMFWSSFSSTSRHVQDAMAKCLLLSEDNNGDKAGPLLDAVALYRTVFQTDREKSDETSSSLVVSRGMYSSIRDIPRHYLVRHDQASARRIDRPNTLFLLTPTFVKQSLLLGDTVAGRWREPVIAWLAEPIGNNLPAIFLAPRPNR